MKYKSKIEGNESVILTFNEKKEIRYTQKKKKKSIEGEPIEMQIQRMINNGEV